MTPHKFSFCAVATAGILAFLLFFCILTGGCLRTEPEELLQPQEPAVTPYQTSTATQPVNVSTTEIASPAPGPLTIVSPAGTVTYRDQNLPVDVKQAVTEFTDGSAMDTVNGFLRWESVRARTNQTESARIRTLIGSIDYAVFNTSLPENMRVFFEISGEQAKKVRNESVFSESGYILASSDPSVIYRRFTASGRDRDGYLSLCAVELRRGDHVLPVNATEREFLISRGGIWDFDREETYEVLDFSPDSVLRYRDEPLKKVRIMYTREHP